MAALLSIIGDLKPSPPSIFGLQTLDQATVTHFLLSLSPDQRKFLICCVTYLSKLEDHLEILKL